MASKWRKLIEPEVKNNNYMLFTPRWGYKGNKRWPWNNLNTAYANIQIAMCQGSRDSTILFTDIHVSKVCYSDIHTLSIVDLTKSQHKWWTRTRFQSLARDLAARTPTQIKVAHPRRYLHVRNIAPSTWPTSSSLQLDSYWILRQESVGVPLFSPAVIVLRLCALIFFLRVCWYKSTASAKPQTWNGTKKKLQNDNNNSKKTKKAKKTITKQNTYAKIHRQCWGWGVDFIERTTEIVLLDFIINVQCINWW